MADEWWETYTPEWYDVQLARTILSLGMIEREVRIPIPFWTRDGFRYRLANAVEGAGICASRLSSRLAAWIMPDGLW